LRAALVQLRLESGKRSANLTNVLRWIDEAADLTPAPDLICLPGPCDYGPNPKGIAAPLDCLGGPFAETVALKAKDLGLFVALGHVDADHLGAYLAVSLFDPDGDAVLRHRGVVVPPGAGTELSGGTALRVADTPLGRVGLLTDTDLREPCLGTSLSAMGATLIVVSSRGVEPDGGPGAKKRLGEVARSCAAFLLVACPAAADGQRKCASSAFDPRGQCLVSATPGREGIVEVALATPTREGGKR